MRASDWQFTSDARWLEARRGYLTASSIVKLLAEYKRVLAGKVDADKAPAFLALAMEQMREPTAEDCESRGMAARGHWLEPRAVEDYNRYMQGKTKVGNPVRSYYHVDDLVIVDPLTRLGWSPDALDRPVRVLTNKLVSGMCAYESALEIKSYGLDRAAKVMQQKKSDREERWQCACAMACLSTLCEMTVVLYLPQLSTFYDFTYARAELEDEVETVLAMAAIWRESLKTVHAWTASMSALGKHARGEAELEAEYLREMADVLRG